MGECARIWRGGCIIRAQFLNDITTAFKTKPDLPNLMMDAKFSRELSETLAKEGKFMLMSEACNGFLLSTDWVGPRPGEWGYGYSYSHDIMWQAVDLP